MKNNKLTIEGALFGLAFLLALGLRLFNVGQAALTDSEAALALPALELARGTVVQIPSQPGYVLWTAAIFFLVGASEFAARFLPALMGSLVALSPWLFKKQLGRVAAVLLAFFLAFDPGLVAASREADGLMLAVGFIIFAAGFLFTGKPVWAGVCTGLALLAGARLAAGLVILGLMLVWMGIERSLSQPQPGSSDAGEYNQFVSPLSLRQMLPGLAGALLLGGTLFFIFPAGLSAIGSGLTVYLQGWAREPLTPLTLMLGALIFYTPFALPAGIWGALAGWRQRDPVDGFLTRWTVTALILALMYPSRQPTDLVWVLIPLWALAARQIARKLAQIQQAGIGALTLAGIVAALLVFAWLNFVALSRLPIGEASAQIRLASIAGSLVFIAIITVLASGGWSSKSAVSGLVCGLSTATLLFTFTASWNAAGLGRNPWSELWRNSPYIQDADLLMQTVGDFSEWNTGFGKSIDITVLEVESPALRWQLRNHRQTLYTNVLPPGELPSLLITTEREMPLIAASYTGQDFVWQRSIDWGLLFPLNWSRWIIVRETPDFRSNLILWVRADLFPGAPALQPAEAGY
ncbi:MAG: hypothetical protein U1B80_09700 [Anaerolineaceae bacterium]|nr:hypothetical protein [Anaerolineaceae bacterium]